MAASTCTECGAAMDPIAAYHGASGMVCAACNAKSEDAFREADARRERALLTTRHDKVPPGGGPTRLVVGFGVIGAGLLCVLLLPLGSAKGFVLFGFVSFGAIQVIKGAMAVVRDN